VSPEEEESDEKEESGHSDDDDDVDDINHETLPKEAVHTNSPTQRKQSEYLEECQDNGDNGENRFFNTPLKLFRSSKDKEDVWSTSAALAHFKNKHEDSSSVHKQKVGTTKRQSRLGDSMHASDSVGIQSISSKKNTYGLSENEKVFITITRWVTYATMKVSQTAFGDQGLHGRRTSPPSSHITCCDEHILMNSVFPMKTY
jgi:hypothetical protein